MGVFWAVTAALLFVSVLARVVGLWTPRRVPAAVAAIPPSPDLYLAYYHAGLEYYAVWDGLYGVADAVRRADVLLLGSSHTKFDWPRASGEPFFAARHLRYYNLGMAYNEGCTFPLALFRKYDLHPKLVVCDLDPFFASAPSAMASKVMADRRWDAVKYVGETRAAFYAQRWLHRVVPPLAGQVPPGDRIYYRSAADGTVLLAHAEALHAPTVRRSAGPWDPWPTMVPTARAFMAEMARRGVRVVFTVDPVSPLADAQGLAAAVNVPLLVPQVDGLYTFDFSHLEKPSAIRFSTAFYQQLGAYLDAHPLP